jgi:hypothetical protein
VAGGGDREGTSKEVATTVTAISSPEGEGMGGVGNRGEGGGSQDKGLYVLWLVVEKVFFVCSSSAAPKMILASCASVCIVLAVS